MGAPVSLGTFKSPIGIAVTPNGDVYVVERGTMSSGTIKDGAIKKVPGGTGTPITLAGGLYIPMCISVAANGDVFFTEQLNEPPNALYAIKKIAGGQGSPVTFYQSAKYVRGIRVTANGDIYFTEDSKVIRMPGGSGRIEISLSNSDLPLELFVTSAGTIFIVAKGGYSGGVYVVQAGATVNSGPRVCEGCLYSGSSVFVSTRGDVYITDGYLHVFFKVSSSGAVTSTHEGLSGPSGIWAMC